MATTANKNAEQQRVTTPTARASHAHVFKAQSPKPGDKPKFSLTFLIPKTADMKGIQRAITAAKVAKFGDNKAKWPQDLESPVKDGDGKAGIDRKTGAKKEGYAGHYVVKASASEERQPEVVDAQLEPIINAKDFYSGCYCRANLYAFYWEYMGKHGISLGLNSVQKVKDGKPFTNRKTAKDVFSPISDDESGLDQEQVETEEETSEMDFR